MIDWDVAISTGVRWARPGPQVSLGEARAVVAELRELADAVSEPVRAGHRHVRTGEDGAAGSRSWTGRAGSGPTWTGSGSCSTRSPSTCASRAARPGGAVIASVGSARHRDAGRADPRLPGRPGARPVRAVPAARPGDSPTASAPAGRLTLVAPNILMVERELGVNPHDFRRWVCLHEETHRTQFTSVPWLRGYVQEQMTRVPARLRPRPGDHSGPAALRRRRHGRARCGAAAATASSRPSRPPASGRSWTA